MAKPVYQPNTGITPRFVLGKGFTTLAGTLTHGEDPAQVGGPPTNRYTDTVRSHVGFVGNDPKGNVLLDTTLRADLTASFVVANNDFSAADWRLVLGDYALRQGVDWLPGPTAQVTANYLVAAINALGGGFTADNSSGTSTTVSISYGNPMMQVGFEFLGSSSVVNFGTITPSNGFMADGVPTFGAPELT